MHEALGKQKLLRSVQVASISSEAVSAWLGPSARSHHLWPVTAPAAVERAPPPERTLPQVKQRTGMIMVQVWLHKGVPDF